MANQLTHYYLLDSKQGMNAIQGWQVQQINNLRTTSEGLVMLPNPMPPKPLNDVAVGLGRLEIPGGITLTPDGTLFISDRQQHLIFKAIRYPSFESDEALCRTQILPLAYFGGVGQGPRQLNEPRGLDVSGNSLYIADSQNHRIQVLRLHSEVLQAIWGGPDPGVSPGEFNEPWDVAVGPKGIIYIADTGNHRLQKIDPRQSRFTVIDGTILKAYVFQVRYGPRQWERFVYLPARQRLEHWPHRTGGDPRSPSEVTVLSTAITSTADAYQWVLAFIGAEGTTDILVESEHPYPLHLAPADPPEPAFDSPTNLAVDRQGHLYVVDKGLNLIKILDGNGWVLGTLAAGTDFSGDFHPSAITIREDGTILVVNGDRVEQFHPAAELFPAFHYGGSCSCRISHCGGITVDTAGQGYVVGETLGLAEIQPPQTYVMSGFYLSQPLDSRIEQCQWHKLQLTFGAEIPVGTGITVWTYTDETLLSLDDILALDATDWQTGQTNSTDFLVLSPPGRYLWLRLEFQGNSIDTPVLKQLRVFFPRVTYLQYLPAVYQSEPVSRDFLERFLSLFETTALSIEQIIDNIARYFDADGVPDEFLTWLAGWVDLTFYPSFSEATRRRLLRNVPELYRRRGTLAGLKQFLRLALGLNVEILEHFRIRRWLFLSQQSVLGEQSQLWDNQIFQRLQLEVNSRIGEFSLISTKDPLRDPFHQYAHRFSVFVPAVLSRDETTQQLLGHLIDVEKPSHTAYELCPVEARFRVGVQSTVGLDTLVGEYPRMVLNECATLGYDTVLSGKDENSPEIIQVNHRNRIGINAVVG
jgi:phage tail-like protein